MSIPVIGQRFRQFVIQSKAGEGGMGVVFRAHDTRLDRDVALKFLTKVLPIDVAAAERLKVEAQSLAALKHWNIVTIYDIDEEDGSPFLILEWVEGSDLRRLTDAGPCAEATFLKIATPITEALAAAHATGIVHRDLKPGNVLLGDDGGVKLVDFGLARLRDAGNRSARDERISGTPAYMSPEQASGRDVGPQSDVFSFGVLAYELLAGRRPFEGETTSAVLNAILNGSYAPLQTRREDLSSELVAAVDRCLMKRPEQRYANGAALASDLHGVVRKLTEGETLALSGRTWGTAAAARSPEGPEIRYCRTSDGASIAYAANGSGPVLVRVLGWFTHVEMEWRWPALRLLWERLAETHTVVRYDGRGIGLSGSWDDEFSERTRELDLEAVLDAVGAERVVLYGISEGGWTAAHYAARFPERISHLVMYGSYSRSERIRPGFDPDESRALLTLMRKGWGRDTPEIRQIFTTAYFGADADPGLIAHFNELQRSAADAETAARYQESLNDRNDAREVFEQIRTPALVIHCRDDRIIPFDEGRRIASFIPGAQFLPLPTTTHYFPVDDDVTRRIVDAIRHFTS
jgi:pimeloyl-ACP methyl ester carboxylesterase